MNDQELYMFDDCYLKPAATTELSFNTILFNSYKKYLTTSVRNCEIQALRNNSDFFLVNDISLGASNTKYTNCYIPKQNATSPSVIGDNSIIERAFNLFSTTFNPFTKQTSTIDTCDNLLYNSAFAAGDQKCFKYSLDKKIYAPKQYYAYYKKPILNESNRNIITQDPAVYKNYIVPLKTYEGLIMIDTVNFANNGALANSFKEYICLPSRGNEIYLDTQIIKLKQFYESLFNRLDDITRDISSVNYLNKFDEETIIALNVRIKDRNKELNNLLGFGGANNGRLDDTTFLTQFKIVENIILILIIISVIFLYNKMRKK